MGTTLKEILQSLPADRVQKIQERANQLKAEEILRKIEQSNKRQEEDNHQ